MIKKYDIQQILDFLKEIKFHNEVEWMHAHREIYEKAKKNFEILSQDILLQMMTIDPSLQQLNAKQCIFRFARDTRFSLDKRPYKTHFGLYLCSNGKKSSGPGYYLHLQPNDEDGDFCTTSMIDVGVHCPTTQEAKLIREKIFDQGEILQKYLKTKEVKHSGYRFLDNDCLKVLPKEFKGSPYEEFIRMKNWDLYQPLTEEQVLTDDFFEYVIESFRIGKGWNDFFIMH